MDGATVGASPKHRARRKRRGAPGPALARSRQRPPAPHRREDPRQGRRAPCAVRQRCSCCCWCCCCIAAVAPELARRRNAPAVRCRRRRRACRLFISGCEASGGDVPRPGVEGIDRSYPDFAIDAWASCAGAIVGSRPTVGREFRCQALTTAWPQLGPWLRKHSVEPPRSKSGPVQCPCPSSVNDVTRVMLFSQQSLCQPRLSSALLVMKPGLKGRWG
jgi:hypothetical protein